MYYDHSDEDETDCPKCGQAMKPGRLLCHLAKCKASEKKELFQCPHNATHFFPAEERSHHLETCKQAAEAELFSQPNSGAVAMHGNLEGPKTFGSDYFVAKTLKKEMKLKGYDFSSDEEISSDGSVWSGEDEKGNPSTPWRYRRLIDQPKVLKRNPATVDSSATNPVNQNAAQPKPGKPGSSSSAVVKVETSGAFESKNQSTKTETTRFESAAESPCKVPDARSPHLLPAVETRNRPQVSQAARFTSAFGNTWQASVVRATHSLSTAHNTGFVSAVASACQAPDVKDNRSLSAAPLACQVSAVENACSASSVRQASVVQTTRPLVQNARLVPAHMSSRRVSVAENPPLLSALKKILGEARFEGQPNNP